MVHKGYKKGNDFTKFKTIQTSGDAFKNVIITIHIANNEQHQLTKKWGFTSDTKPRSYTNWKKGTINSTMALLKGRKWFIMPLKAKYFHYFQQDQRNEVNQRIQANQSTQVVIYISSVTIFHQYLKEQVLAYWHLD